MNAPGGYARVVSVVKSHRQRVIQLSGVATFVWIVEEKPGLAAQTRAWLAILPWPRIVIVIEVFRLCLFGVSLFILIYDHVTASERMFEVKAPELRSVSRGCHRYRREDWYPVELHSSSPLPSPRWEITKSGAEIPECYPVVLTKRNRASHRLV